MDHPRVHWIAPVRVPMQGVMSWRHDIRYLTKALLRIVTTTKFERVEPLFFRLPNLVTLLPPHLVVQHIYSLSSTASRRVATTPPTPPATRIRTRII